MNELAASAGVRLPENPPSEGTLRRDRRFTRVYRVGSVIIFTSPRGQLLPRVAHQRENVKCL